MISFKQQYRLLIIVLTAFVGILVFVSCFETIFLSTDITMDIATIVFSPNSPSHVDKQHDVMSSGAIFMTNDGLIQFGDGIMIPYIFPTQTVEIVADKLMNNPQPMMLVSILSHCLNFDLRQYIRDTWFNYNVNFKPYFVIAYDINKDDSSNTNNDNNNNNNNLELTNKIVNEFIKYNDLIILKTDEDYRTILPYKSLGSFQIFEKYFGNTIGSRNKKILAVLKTDDDSYVRMNKVMNNAMLLTDFDDKKKSNMFYFGICFRQKKIDLKLRSNMSKNPITKQLWQSDYLPDYCAGEGYTISWDLMICINKFVINKKTYHFMPIEDIATGIYAQLCNVSITNHAGYHSLTNAKNPKKDKFQQFTLWHYINNKTMFDRFWNWELPQFKKHTESIKVFDQ